MHQYVYKSTNYICKTHNNSIPMLTQLIIQNPLLIKQAHKWLIHTHTQTSKPVNTLRYAGGKTLLTIFCLESNQNKLPGTHTFTHSLTVRGVSERGGERKRARERELRREGWSGKDAQESERAAKKRQWGGGEKRRKLYGCTYGGDVCWAELYTHDWGLCARAFPMSTSVEGNDGCDFPSQTLTSLLPRFLSRSSREQGPGWGWQGGATGLSEDGQIQTDKQMRRTNEPWLSSVHFHLPFPPPTLSQSLVLSNSSAISVFHSLPLCSSLPFAFLPSFLSFSLAPS